MLQALAQLRVSRVVLDEVAPLLDADVWLFDDRRRAAVRLLEASGARGRLVVEAPDAPRWPGCVPFPDAPQWVPCERTGGGVHLVARVRGSNGDHGWLVSGSAAAPAPASRDVVLRLVALVVDEMGRYAEHRRSLTTHDQAALAEIVGVSTGIEEARTELRRAITAPYPVLIEGETGTGKDLAAWCIHHKGPRAKGRYVALNCAAMPETLLESTLFGHRRGAFTGAVRDEPGLLLAARGGTLFLDEVAELSLVAQAKLLRAIEGGEVLAVGATKAEKTDARIIAATNAELETAAAERRFRSDLLYRLRVLSVRMPPLRERREDIPHLARHVVKQVGERLGVLILGFSDDALAALVSAPWPGNVRELIHEIERAAVRCDGSRIERKHLSPGLRASPTPGAPSNATDGFFGRSRAVVETWERDQLEKTLVAANWNVAQAAIVLGVSRRMLFNRIKAFGLRRPERK